MDYMYLVDSYYDYQKELLNKKRPLIFVPGLLGSMGDDIIPGTGDWGFGMAKSIYIPFLEMLEELGYKRDKNLFISFYDWRKSCDYSAREFLYEKIKYVKNKTFSPKVDLICHSMGGLIARAYVQSNYYKDDVQNLIMIGTPNAGSAKAYIFWSGGKVPDKGKLKGNIFEAIVDGYIWILSKRYNLDNIETIREHIKGVGDLLPNAQYGNYLYYKDTNGFMVFLPYGMMEEKNYFLDKLNSEVEILFKRNIKITTIAGVGNDTDKYFNISNNKEGKSWQDGKVIGVYKSKEGDGTVLAKSVGVLGGDRYILQGSHSDILLKSKYIINKKLLKNTNFLRASRHKIPKYYNEYISLRIKGKGNIYIRSEFETKWIKLNEDMKMKGSKIFVSKFPNNIIWVIIQGSNLNCIKIKYQALEKNIIDINLSKNDKIIIDRKYETKRKEDVAII